MAQRAYSLPVAWALTDQILNRALVGATDSTGKSIISGNKVTGFSNVEEEQAGKTVPKHMSFLLETKVSIQSDRTLP